MTNKQPPLVDKDTQIVCEKCKERMINLGNVNLIYYNERPFEAENIHICHKCKVKTITRVALDYPSLTVEEKNKMEVDDFLNNLLKASIKEYKEQKALINT